MTDRETKRLLTRVILLEVVCREWDDVGTSGKRWGRAFGNCPKFATILGVTPLVKRAVDHTAKAVSDESLPRMNEYQLDRLVN